MDNSSQCDEIIPGYVGPLEAHEILGEFLSYVSILLI